MRLDSQNAHRGLDRGLRRHRVARPATVGQHEVLVVCRAGGDAGRRGEALGRFAHAIGAVGVLCGEWVEVKRLPRVDDEHPAGEVLRACGGREKEREGEKGESHEISDSVTSTFWRAGVSPPVCVKTPAGLPQAKGAT